MLMVSVLGMCTGMGNMLTKFYNSSTAIATSTSTATTTHIEDSH